MLSDSEHVTIPQESDDRHAPPATVVIFGASGDLTRRKLIPAIESLARHNRLTEQFAVVGVARTPMDDDQFIHAVLGDRGLSGMPQLNGAVRYIAGGYDDPETYKRLATVLDDLDRDRGTAGNRIFYLSTPAEAFPLVINGLAGAGLHRAREGSFARLVIEKPYGHNEASAKQLDTTVHAAFDESQVFRIDHYLGKDTVQNVLALRFANAIFQPIWDRTWVDHVQITVAETLGVGTRGSFYEHAGAMRDIVQNHVLQVLALALMEPPASFSAEAVRNEKVKLLQAIRLPSGRAIDDIAVRGQYTRGGSREELMAGYREEPGVDPLSRTETFAALRLDVDNWRWAGVPFYVRTGKRLPSRVTEVALQFQRPPHLPIPNRQLTELQPDALILRIQPDEGIALRFGAKVPGHSFRVRSASMDFSYDKTFREESPEAYERLLLDALIGDTTLFIRSDEVEQCWRIVDPILERWAEDTGPIPTYEAASWGPTEANRLIERSGRAWRNTVSRP
ncbi:glucose-6-phosphate dehydrogenase [Dactylosporangium maewongense]|uniref:Glucose-6-phosphate 1-dehydrogenase n=1 Tax=Dactylosporangium maewongense TaxID=634393 RepID=A0ABP4LPC7_9ACTN